MAIYLAVSHRSRRHRGQCICALLDARLDELMVINGDRIPQARSFLNKATRSEIGSPIRRHIRTEIGYARPLPTTSLPYSPRLFDIIIQYVRTLASELTSRRRLTPSTKRHRNAIFRHRRYIIIRGNMLAENGTLILDEKTDLTWQYRYYDFKKKTEMRQVIHTAFISDYQQESSYLIQSWENSAPTHVSPEPG
jgi:hypothetical protein